MKTTKSAWSLLLLILVSGCVAEAVSVAPGDTVSVHYTGTLDDGTVFDSSEGKSPLTFEAGAGQMIKGFDSAVIGMELGETKTIRISPEEAYGPYREEMVQNVSKNQFGNETVPPVGSTVYYSGGSARIVAIYDDNVTVDFNHQLAGKALSFEITVVDIQKGE